MQTLETSNAGRLERKSNLLTDYRKTSKLLNIATGLVNQPQFCSIAERHFNTVELTDL